MIAAIYSYVDLNAISHSFFKLPALCAAFFPSSVSTIYCGLSFDALTSCPLILVGVVCFFTTLPWAVPPLDFQLTLSPFFNVFSAMSFLLGGDRLTRLPLVRSPARGRGI
jgi:hypothetical protein